MRILFLILLVIMAGLSVLAISTLPEHLSDAPLLWWSTDTNPARGPQIATFEQWMKDKGYRNVNLELDSSITTSTKVIIQSISGVGSEIIDIYNGGQLRQYVAAGVLADITELAAEYGFGLDKTYSGARNEFFVDERQYAFPCNVTAWPLTINKALLEREGLPLPKFDWTWDEFIDWCLKVRKVDEKGNITRFAIWPLFPEHLCSIWATNGGTVFNETMTKCTINSSRVIEAAKFYYDLMFKYKVMPTPVEQKSGASQGGFKAMGGSAMQWLGNGLVVAVSMGRFGLIQLRKFENFKPDVALLPHKLTPIQISSCRSAGINAGASDKKLVARFQQFLASDTYNRIIVGDTDALPPNPRMAYTEEFLTPAKYPGEHGAHEKYRRAMEEYSVGSEYNKFIVSTTVDRITKYYDSGITSKSITVEQAMERMTDELNMEIQHAIERDSKLEQLYKKALVRQAEIDRLKAAGKPIPLEMVDNPVIRYLMEAGKWQ